MNIECLLQPLKNWSNRSCMLLLAFISFSICLVSIWHMKMTPCSATMHLKITDLYPKDLRINAFCTLQNSLTSQLSFSLKRCSSSGNGQRGFEIYYNKFLYDCIYCCVLRQLEAVDEKLASIGGTFTAEKATVQNQTISHANCSLDQHLTLAEIGIKKVFLINLDRRIDRLSSVLKMLGYLRLPCTRFSAIDVHKFREQMDKFDPRTRFIRNTSFINNINAHTATWQSHLQILFKIVDEASENDRPVLILEDDLDMEVNAPYLLKKTLNLLPNDWEMFLLGHSHMECRKVYENNICRANFFYCAVAYVIRNATVARKLINWSNTEAPQIADWYWQEYIKKDLFVVYGAYPNHIVIQDRGKFGTDIGSPAIPDIKLQNPLSKMIQ